MRRLIVFIIAAFTVCSSARSQNILGKHPADKVLPGFYQQNGNADTTVDGLNGNATHTLNATLLTPGTVNSNLLDFNTMSWLQSLGTGGGGGSGEANVAQNLGTGVGLYAGKSGVALQLRSIAATGGATVSTNQTNVIISADAPGAAATVGASISNNIASLLPTYLTTNNNQAVWTNSGWFVANATGFTFARSDGFFINSNAINRTCYIRDTNRNSIWLSNGVTRATIGPSGNMTIAQIYTGQAAQVNVLSTNATGDGSLTILGNVNIVQKFSSDGEAVHSDGGGNLTVGGIFGDASGLTGIPAGQISGIISAANLGTGTANNTTFLRGDGTYATPTGSGNFNGPGSSVSGNFIAFNGTSGSLGQDSLVSAASFDPAGAATTATNGLVIPTPNILYVETNGNDATAVLGMRNKPWKTFTNALTSISATPAAIILGAGTFYTDPRTNGSVIPSNVAIRGQGISQTFLIPGNLSQATTNANGAVPLGLVLSGDNIDLSGFTCGTNANNGTYYIPIALAQGTNLLIHAMTIFGDSDGIWGNGTFPWVMNTNCSGSIDDVKIVTGFDAIVMVAVNGGTNSSWRIQNTRININGDANFPSVQNRGIFVGHFTNTVQNCNITVNSPSASQVFGVYVQGTGMTNYLTLANNIFGITGTSPLFLNCSSSHAVTTVRGLLDPNQVAQNSSVINWDAADGSRIVNIQPTNIVGSIDATGLTANHHVYSGPGTNLISSEDATGYTNTVSWLHEGTATNLTATFIGTPQSFTCTNGPSVGQDYFIHFAGANGSCSYRFVGSAYHILHFDYQPGWLAGSNNVITNGVLSLTSYGGTNAAQIEAAMGENQ